MTVARSTARTYQAALAYQRGRASEPNGWPSAEHILALADTLVIAALALADEYDLLAVGGDVLGDLVRAEHDGHHSADWATCAAPLCRHATGRP